MALLKHVNIRGDLFATASVFLASAVVKLFSSLIVTRILQPADYGVVTVLLSISAVVDMLADLGTTLFFIRNENAEDPRILDTVWTVRLARSVINCVVLFVGGPLIATYIYHTPSLATPLRVYSVIFLITGMETMAFPMAIRQKRSRLAMYTEFAATIVGTGFSVTYCYYSRDYWGMIYGMLIGRAVVTLSSYQFYREHRPRLRIDRAALREIFAFSKFVMPSTLLTLGLNQFDKIVFLRIFDLSLLGVYGLAANFSGPIEALIYRISNWVLYPRCAHNFRTDRASVYAKYYSENVKLFISIMAFPAIVGGASRFVIALLYPARYAEAAAVLQAFMLRAALQSLANPSEDLLIACGESQIILIGNIFRAIWLFSASLIGYYLDGFIGFTYGAALSGLPPLVYYLWLQNKKHVLNVKYEAYKVLFVAALAVSAYAASSLLLYLWPNMRLRG